MNIKNSISQILTESQIDFTENDISNIHILLLTLAECEHSFYMTNHSLEVDIKSEFREINFQNKNNQAA
jgi:hypothetical protein